MFATREGRMLEVLDQFWVYEPRSRAGVSSGILVPTRWELPARPDGSAKARFAAREFTATVRPDLCVPAVSAGSTAGMDMMALMHGWAHEVVDATHAQFRGDIGYCVRLLSRDILAPTEGSLTLLKSIGRYLAGTRDPMQEVRRPTNRVLEVLSDSDWAGCHRTRKSTSAGLLRVGARCSFRSAEARAWWRCRPARLRSTLRSRPWPRLST